jgi:hypothetical protein
MEYSLTFSSFYMTLVKKNTSLRQYDAVSVLLLGKLRSECIDNVITDQMATHYVHGTKKISKEILSPLLQCSVDEISKRIRMLSFQDVDAVANEGVGFLNRIPSLGEQIKNDLLSIYSSKGSYTFLAEFFLSSLKPPVIVDEASPKENHKLKNNAITQLSSFWDCSSSVQFRQRLLLTEEDKAQCLALIDQLLKNTTYWDDPTDDCRKFLAPNWTNYTAIYCDGSLEKTKELIFDLFPSSYESSYCVIIVPNAVTSDGSMMSISEVGSYYGLGYRIECMTYKVYRRLVSADAHYQIFALFRNFLC